MTSSAQTPEPTDEQRAAMLAALDCERTIPFGRWADRIDPQDRAYCLMHGNDGDGWPCPVAEDAARALAAAVTAEREKVEAHLSAIALEMEADQVEYGHTNGRYYARRIREVSR